jgi:hypothetical protein
MLRLQPILLWITIFGLLAAAYQAAALAGGWPFSPVSLSVGLLGFLVGVAGLAHHRR